MLYQYAMLLLTIPASSSFTPMKMPALAWPLSKSPTYFTTPVNNPCTNTLSPVLMLTFLPRPFFSPVQWHVFCKTYLQLEHGQPRVFNGLGSACCIKRGRKHNYNNNDGWCKVKYYSLIKLDNYPSFGCPAINGHIACSSQVPLQLRFPGDTRLIATNARFICAGAAGWPGTPRGLIEWHVAQDLLLINSPRVTNELFLPRPKPIKVIS